MLNWAQAALEKCVRALNSKETCKVLNSLLLFVGLCLVHQDGAKNAETLVTKLRKFLGRDSHTCSMLRVLVGSNIVKMICK